MRDKGAAPSTTARKPAGLRLLRGATTSKPAVEEWLPGIADALGRAICEAVLVGNAVLVGKTSDGGALSVTVYSGQDRFRSYPSSIEELEELLSVLADPAN